jgi:fused signal recognition particle receptor
LFESLKKKFSNVSGKLTKKFSDEANKENNIKSSDENKWLEDVNSKQDMLTTEDDDLQLENIETDKKTSVDIDDKDSILDNTDNKSLAVDNTDFDEDVVNINSSKSHDSDKSAEDNSTLEDSPENNKKRGFFSFIREKTISEKDVDDILWELEMSLLEADVAIDVANAVVDSVKNDIVGQKIRRSKDVSDITFNALKKAVSNIITIEGKTILELIGEKRVSKEPLVIMFVGINGTGKTTTIAKLANYFIKKDYTPVVAASDTFRAGAIEQITHHTDKIGIKIIKHQKGSDPAAVAFDAIEHAKAKGKELVLIDTAGRMQTNTNLMDEMKKIKRVAKPDLIIFVGDALTGNDVVEQATKFNEAIDIDGVILTKVDADSKGGASLSIGHVIQKPIMFLGMGQGYDDIIEYDPDWMLEQIFS